MQALEPAGLRPGSADPEVELPRLEVERGRARRDGELPLQPTLLRLQPPHLGTPLVERVPRVEVRAQRPIVEERHERDGDHDHEPPPTGPGRRGHGRWFGVTPRGPFQATSPLITLVVPGTFASVPAVITTRSPGATSPFARTASRERDQRSSTFAHSGISSGVTPHSSAICWSA